VNSLLFSGSMTKDDLKLLERVKTLGFDMFEATPSSVPPVGVIPAGSAG
jgi:beta-galactosidase GanA